MFDFHINPEIRRDTVSTMPQRKLGLRDFKQSSQDCKASGGAELVGNEQTGLLTLVLILLYHALPLK